MSSRRWWLLLVGCAAPAVALQPETYAVPRTEHGHPDFQGIWATEFLTPLERPKGIEGLVVDPARARALVEAIRSNVPSVIDPDFHVHDIRQLAMVEGQYRTSIVVEPETGSLPYSQAGLELAQRILASMEASFDDPEQRPLPERCLENFGFAPIRAIPFFLPRRIHQTREHVLILSEDAVGLRIIHLTGEPPPDVIRSVEGHSQGHWEGDTLVVRTTHLEAEYPARFGLGRPIVLSPESRIEERFTRVSDRELRYRYTVEDSALYTAPWTGELSMTRQDVPIFEYACHEGNYSLVFSLRGSQAEADRLAAENQHAESPP